MLIRNHTAVSYKESWIIFRRKDEQVSAPGWVSSNRAKLGDSPTTQKAELSLSCPPYNFAPKMLILQFSCGFLSFWPEGLPKSWPRVENPTRNLISPPMLSAVNKYLEERVISPFSWDFYNDDDIIKVIIWPCLTCRLSLDHTITLPAVNFRVLVVQDSKSKVRSFPTR